MKYLITIGIIAIFLLSLAITVFGNYSNETISQNNHVLNSNISINGSNKIILPFSLGTFDWGQFHGNYTHNGYSAWSGPTKATLLWKKTIGSPSMNTLEAENGILIANSVSNNTIKGLNESSGNIIYTFQLPQSTLATSYAPAGGGNIYFEAWTPSLGSPDLYYLYICADSLSSGTNVWQTGPSDLWITVGTLPANWSPLYGYDVETYMNGIVYNAPLGSGTLYAYNYETGMQMWSLNVNNNIDEIPTGGDGILLLSFSNNASVTAITYSGQWLWNFTTDSIVSDVPAFSGGAFYFGTVGGYLYKISSNGQLIWKVSIGMGAITNTPTIANGLVYIGCANGVTYALNDTNGNISWVYTDNNAITSSPVVSSNDVLFETDSGGNVMALNATTGHLMWQYYTGGVVSASPVLDHGYLFVITTNGTIFAFGQAYQVNFVESGLPSGTPWSVSLDSTNKTSNGNSIQFLVQNGSYSYRIGEVIGYSSSPSFGTVIVNGKNVNVSISFSQGWSLPSAPRNLTATGSFGQIILKWEPPSNNGAPPGFNGSGIEAYYIYRSTSPGQEQYYDKVNGTQLTYVDSSVTSGTIYFYVITAVNPVGQSGFSNEASAEPVVVTAPSPPTNLTALPETNGIYLTFNPPLSNGGSKITEYIIYKGTTPGSEQPYVTLSPNVTSYLDTNVVPGQTYIYFVVAVNSAGSSNPSATVTVVASKNVPSIPFYYPSSPEFIPFMESIVAIGTAILVIDRLVDRAIKRKREKNPPRELY